MDLEQFIVAHGLLAIAIGVLIEGEAVMLIGGYLAHEGYLDIYQVVLAGFLGTFLGAEGFFYLGRWQGERAQARRPEWRDRARRVHGWLDRFRTPFILFYRFLYGFRTISPMVIGTSTVDGFRFLIYNAIGSFVWTALLGVLGYEFGRVAERFVAQAQMYEKWVILGMALVGVVIVVVFQLRKRSRKWASPTATLPPGPSPLVVAEEAPAEPKPADPAEKAAP